MFQIAGGIILTVLFFSFLPIILRTGITVLAAVAALLAFVLLCSAWATVLHLPDEVVVVMTIAAIALTYLERTKAFARLKNKIFSIIKNFRK